MNVSKVLVVALALVLVVFSFGVCFADSSVSSPVFMAGENIPIFSQLISGTPFYVQFPVDSSVMDDFEPLYNDVSYRISSVSSSGIYVYCKRGDSTVQVASALNPSTTMLGFVYYSGGSCWVGISPISNPSLSGDSSKSALANISVQYGSSFEWSDANASASLYSMTLEPGYAIVISSDSEVTIQDIQLSYPNTWNFPKGQLSSSRYNGSRYGLYSSFDVGANLSADRGNLIPWVPLNANLFGKASSYSFEWEPSDYSLFPSYSYVITNPLYGGEAVQNESAGFNKNGDMICTIYYATSGNVNFEKVALRQVLSSENGTIFYSNIFDPDVYSASGTLVPGEDTDPGSVTFPSAPVGGGNANEPPLSEETTVSGLFQTLVSEFTNFFRKASEAVHSISDSCTSFFQSVLAMFSWIPAEWASVIFAFFVIVSAFGLIKILR